MRCAMSFLLDALQIWLLCLRSQCDVAQADRALVGIGLKSQVFRLRLLRILPMLLVFGLPARAEVLSGRVVEVGDGDTIVVSDSLHRRHTVRLAAIDAPEYTQPHGRQSRANLARLVEGHAVTISYHRRDRWQRLVGKVYVDGRDVNARQLLDGYAWHFRRYRREQPRAEWQVYRAAEQHARRQKLGLWADGRPVPPWKWRQVKRRAAR
jgi:endonuclease YncB( thermonuclease family)